MRMNDPSKNQAQDSFEQHLRGFRPVAPRVLEIPVRAPWGVLAVAAGVLLVVALSLVMKSSQHPGGTVVARGPEPAVPHATVVIPITLGTLNAALHTNDQDLNKILDAASPTLLPREHRGTALFELGKE